MPEFKGTTGPWLAHWSLGYRTKVTAGKATICRLDRSASSEATEEDKANALLIAAAPDLLRACQAADWESWGLPLYVRIELKAAIDKALGQ